MNSVKLHIGEQEVLSTELTYEQLVLLYQQYTASVWEIFES